MSKKENPATLKALIEAIQSGDSEAEALLYLFLRDESYPSIRKYIINRSGDEEDAQDFFQDAFMICLDAIKKGKFTLNRFNLRSAGNQIGAYLMSVVKNLWRKELRWRGRGEVQLEEGTKEIMSFDLFANLIKDAFEVLGDECQEVLSLYFRENYSPRVIGSKLGKKTEVVKTQLAKCIDKLLKDIGHLLGENHQDKLQELMIQSLDDLEERCQKILKLFYFERKSMTELAEELGYANAHSVTEQKRRCMIRLNHAVVNRLMNPKKPLQKPD